MKLGEMRAHPGSHKAPLHSGGPSPCPAVTNGNLWICKVQVGDKRWFKGVKKDAEGAINSFTV